MMIVVVAIDDLKQKSCIYMYHWDKFGWLGIYKYRHN